MFRREVDPPHPATRLGGSAMFRREVDPPHPATRLGGDDSPFESYLETSAKSKNYIFFCWQQRKDSSIGVTPVPNSGPLSPWQPSALAARIETSRVRVTTLQCTYASWYTPGRTPDTIR
ncbi:hypothetical protein QE152_g1411 [Popillia japonica]|uniref:Uncharacterized protein n=1 Tax=Popillia japonica TaxID=7064 RepID=A0AAW1N4F6_POPJA